jgi:hypothetical protein
MRFTTLASSYGLGNRENEAMNVDEANEIVYAFSEGMNRVTGNRALTYRPGAANITAFRAYRHAYKAAVRERDMLVELWNRQHRADIEEAY